LYFKKVEIRLLLGYQDIKVVNGEEIKINRAYLVKDNSTDAQLQYNGT
jgi:hypothetical protein